MRRKSYASPCRYRVVAAGVTNKGSIIDITTNTHRLLHRGYHAEEVLLHRNPRNLVLVIIARFNKHGKLLPIDPCAHCSKLAGKYGVKIVALL